jgi:asparagine synthase (glutamine-hydrolysing)
MCGIAGFIDSRKTLQDLQQMTRCLSHRGPDDEGYFFDEGVGLGHRRLSIIDLSASGHQPMFFENLVIIFNGEIYNYKEIRTILERKGYSFQSSSDTEVVIKAFHCWREKFLDHFIGMFAFSIYDKKEKSLYLFRDRVGVKPLYYYHKGNNFAFCSELKAFKQYIDPEEKKELNPEAISCFFRFGYISNGYSIIKDVFKLPPGHFLKYQNNKIDIKQYWQVCFEENGNVKKIKENDLLDELESLSVSAFKYRMVADVPVGVFLSAGIDSSLVAAVLSKHAGQIQTFTIGFAEKDFDESADAKKIAAHLGSVHTEAVLYPEKGQEILSHFYDIYDEPHGDNSCVPTTFVSALAKSKGVKVVLSADGGDELFGGYSRYTGSLSRWEQIRKTGKLFPRFLQQNFKMMQGLASVDTGYKYNRFNSILSQKDFPSFYQMILRPNSEEELSALINNYHPHTDKINASEPFNQMMEWDFYHYLPDNNLVKVDRATMYNSIEGREPFLDHRLIEFAAKLPLEYKIRGGTTKYLLKKLLGRYLPKELYDLPKRGFGAPIQQWLRNNYEKDIRAIFHPSVFENPYLNREEVLAFVNRYHKKKNINMVTMWWLYSFQKWYNKWNNAND